MALTDKELIDLFMESQSDDFYKDDIFRTWAKPPTEISGLNFYKKTGEVPENWGMSSRTKDVNEDGIINEKDRVDGQYVTEHAIGKGAEFSDDLKERLEAAGYPTTNYTGGSDYMRAWEQFYSDNPGLYESDFGGINELFDHDPIDGPKPTFGTVPYMDIPTSDEVPYNLVGDSAQVLEDLLPNDKRITKFGGPFFTDYVPAKLLETADRSLDYAKIPIEVLQSMWEGDIRGGSEALYDPLPFIGPQENNSSFFSDLAGKWGMDGLRNYDPMYEPRWDTGYMDWIPGIDEYTYPADIVKEAVAPATGIWSAKKGVNLLEKTSLGQRLMSNLLPYTKEYLSNVTLKKPYSVITAGGFPGMRTQAQIDAGKGKWSSMIKNLKNFKNPPAIPAWIRNWGSTAFLKSLVGPAAAEDIFLGQDRGYLPSTQDMIVPSWLKTETPQDTSYLNQNNISPPPTFAAGQISTPVKPRPKDLGPRNNYQGL